MNGTIGKTGVREKPITRLAANRPLSAIGSRRADSIMAQSPLRLYLEAEDTVAVFTIAISSLALKIAALEESPTTPIQVRR